MENQITLKLIDQSIAAGASATSVAQSAVSYDHIIIALSNDAVTTASVDVLLSYDGVNFNHSEVAIASGTGQYRFAKINVNAPFIKVKVTNGDTVAHTIKVHAFFVEV